MRVYLSGKISGLDWDEANAKFLRAKAVLEADGYEVLYPTSMKPGVMGYEDYMALAFTMIDRCDAVCFLEDYVYSRGAMREYFYARAKDKRMMFWENGRVSIMLEPEFVEEV